MISVILLILTVILVAIGGIFGFRRGIILQGVRMVLWGVLFAGSCFFIPQLADTLPVILAKRFGFTVADVEQLVAKLLEASKILQRDTYLILPMAGFVRTLLMPVLVIVFYWATGLVSGLVYGIVALCVRNSVTEKKVYSKLAGMLLGIFLALFGGALTLYPVAAASGAVSEGDSEQILCEEFGVVKMIASSYEGSIVKPVYKFSGTEWMGRGVHNFLQTSVVLEETNHIWNALPDIVRVGAEGWQTYSVVMDNASNPASMKEQMEQTVEAFFSLSFISDENQVLLLKRLKSTLGTSTGNAAMTGLLDWLDIQSKEQVINDAGVCGGVYDILDQNGILDAVINGDGMPALEEEAGMALVTTLYELSNAETVLPEILNLLYSTMLGSEDKELIRTELTWNEQTRDDISEVVSVICKLSSMLEQMDSLSIEQKKNALEAVKSLKDNNAVGNENYAALLKYIMTLM